MKANFKSLWKGAAALALSAALLFTSTAPALAAGDKQPTYENAGFKFEKVSHMDTDVEQPDGIIDYVENVGGGVAPYIPGESEKDHGDRGQSYSYAVATYGDWAYINTMYFGLNLKYILENDAMPGMDWETAKALVDVLFNGHVNFGNEDGAMSGGVLVKVNVKTGETKVLMSRNTNGLIPTFRNAAVMNGKIYFVGMILDTNVLPKQAVDLSIAMQNGQPVVYEIDPANNDAMRPVYECVAKDKVMDFIRSQVFPSTRAIGTYTQDNKEYLVAGGIGIADQGVGDSYLVLSADPSKGQDSFVKIASMEDLFGYPASGRADATGGGGTYQVIQYNGSLYVGICSGSVDTINEYGTMRPFAVVRGDCSGDPTDPESWTWTSVIGDKEKDGAKYTFGIDPSRVASVGVTLETYGGYLYIGEYNDSATALRSAMNSKTFDAMYTNLRQSINLYRMDEDENIEMVVGDPTDMFPEGGISGVGSGYDTHMSQYTWQTEVYEGKMYLSTMDMTTMMHPMAQLVNGELINLRGEDLIRQLNYIRVLIELLSKKDDNVVNAVNAASAVPMSADASVKNAKLMTVVNTAVTAAQKSSGKSVTLTSTQISDLLKGLLDGSLLEGILDEETLKDLEELNGLLEDLIDILDKNDPLGMFTIYLKLMTKLEKLAQKLPDILEKLYEAVINNETLKVIRNILGTLENMKDSVAGFDLYEITQAEDGSVSIRTITNDGFGDRYNHGLRIFAQTPDYLLIGTANPFYGTQLWRRENTVPGHSDIDPVDPTDPVDPDPTDPVDPDPTDPVNPDPTDPVNPDPTDPVNPDPTDPVNPDPTDPVNPDPTDPETTDPVDPDTTDPETTDPETTDPEATKPAEPTTPQTGDTMPLVLMTAALLASGLLMTAIITAKKRREF